MTLEAITLVIEPPRVAMPPPGVSRKPGDPLARYREFAEAMQAHTTVPISVIEATLRDAPPGALVVRSSDYEAMMDEIPAGARAGYASRTLLFDVDRSTILALLERHGFVGGVERNRWFEWRMERGSETGGGLHGRRDLAAAIGGRCISPPSFESARYCVLGSERFNDLAGLIVGYLAASACA